MTSWSKRVNARPAGSRSLPEQDDFAGVHPGVIISGLSAICASLALVASIGRAIYKAVATSNANTDKIASLLKDVDELRDIVVSHTTALAVIKALGHGQPDDEGETS